MTRTWSRELAENCTVNAVNPGPVATDMYSSSSKEFQLQMSTWTRNTPLAAVRDDVDEQRFIDDKEFAGGRPVSFSPRVFVSSSLFFYFCDVLFREGDVLICSCV